MKSRTPLPQSDEQESWQLSTGNADLDDACKGVTPAECLKTAKKFAKWSGLIREALGRAGHGEGVEHSCSIQGNYAYIRLGLSRNQARLIKQFAKHSFYPKDRRSATAAWYLLNTALAHLPLIEQLIKKDLSACQRNEGSSESWFLEGRWDRKAHASLKSLN